MFWYVKKERFTTTCKLCNKDINVAHMAFGALKQHSEEKIHIGFSAQLVEVCVAKQIGSVKTLTMQGTEIVTGKRDE